MCGCTLTSTGCFLISGIPLLHPSASYHWTRYCMLVALEPSALRLARAASDAPQPTRPADTTANNNGTTQTHFHLFSSCSANGRTCGYRLPSLRKRREPGWLGESDGQVGSVRTMFGLHSCAHPQFSVGYISRILRQSKVCLSYQYLFLI